jgi:hypothetical protein
MEKSLSDDTANQKESRLLTRTKKGCLMRIGIGCSNFHRVYQKRKEINYSVHSEIMDGFNLNLNWQEGIKPISRILIYNQIEGFEKRLTKHFF